LSKSRKFFTRLEKFGRAGEDAVLVIILTSMILLAAAQILLRNLFNFGFIWSDEVLRMLVLWLALGGAVAASRSDKHINVAVLDRFLPRKARQFLKILIHLFTAGVCGVVTWNSVLFVHSSYEFGDRLMGNVPAWLPQLILPVGFGLICYRYSMFVIAGIIRLMQGQSRP